MRYIVVSSAWEGFRVELIDDSNVVTIEQAEGKFLQNIRESGDTVHGFMNDYGTTTIYEVSAECQVDLYQHAIEEDAR